MKLQIIDKEGRVRARHTIPSGSKVEITHDDEFRIPFPDTLIVRKDESLETMYYASHPETEGFPSKSELAEYRLVKVYMKD